MSRPQGSHSQEVQATALAMTLAGESLGAIAHETGLPHRTLARWRQRWRELAPEQLDGPNPIRDNEQVIALRAQALQHKWLDALDHADNDQLLKQGMTLNAIRGTAVDKATGGSQPQSTGPLVIAIFPGDNQPPTFDGTAQPLPDPDPD